MRKLLPTLPFVFVMMLAPLLACAHEVYVLMPEQIASDTSAMPFDMVRVALQNLHQFIFWGFIGFVTVSTVFFISIFRVFEKMLDPFFARAKKYAPRICRITVALGLLAGAYYQTTFGPELPLSHIYDAAAPLVAALLAIIGVCMVFGLRVRAAALGALALFTISTWFNGVYMLTYANYFGEFLVLALIGAYAAKQRIANSWVRYEAVIIRVSFGISLFYSSLYAKILHNNLALQVASLPLAGHAHGVAFYFGFEPHFMVLGAAIIEIALAIFFIVGFEIRWSCIFLEFWLALSLWWFGESVWPHLILIGIPIALFLWGYDQYSLEGRFFKRGNLEPVL